MKYLGKIQDDKDLVTKEYVDDEVATKQDTLVSGTNIKTINNTSLLGSGNINVGGPGTETDPIFTASPAYGITDTDIDNWDGKQDELVSGTNIKTINNESLLGSGNISITGGGSQSTWWGTSSTLGSTTNKIVTCADFSLTTGAIISVYFSTGNTTSAPTLNVNSTGAKSIYVGNSECDGITNVLKWSANTVLTFMYDGTYWKYISSVSAGSVSPSRGAGTWHGYSYTSTSVDTKIANIPNFVLTEGAVVAIEFALGNSSDSLNLNVSYTGTKSVYRGTSVVSGSNPLKWSDGETLTFIYDGNYWTYISSSCNIGQRLEHTPAATSCQTGKWYQVAYLTLPAGTWLVDCNAYFPATNATGTRQIFITSATSGYNNVTTPPASIGNITRDVLQGINAGQYPQCHFSLVVDTPTTYRLEAYQGSNTTMNVTGRMMATRIK